MLESLYKILLVNGAILVIPGVNFYLITNVGMYNGKYYACVTACGITFAIMLHVLIALCGAYNVLTIYPYFIEVVKILGFLYINFLALRLLKSSLGSRSYLELIGLLTSANIANTVKKIFTKEINHSENHRVSALANTSSSCFVNGFVVDILNPYISLFYLSFFPKLINFNTTLSVVGIYILFIFFITIIWFLFIALIFSHQAIKKAFLVRQNIIELFSAFILLYCAFQLYN